MKKILTTFAFSFLFLSLTYAQVSKGTLLLDGEIGLAYQSSTNGTSEGVDFTFSPIAGYFLSDRFMVGGGFATETILAEGVDDTSFGFVPTIRYYFNPSSTRFNYFGQLGAVIQLSDNGTNAYSATLGVNKFLNPNVALEGGFSYSLVDDTFFDETVRYL